VVPQQGAGRQRARKPCQSGGVVYVSAGFSLFPRQSHGSAVTITSAGRINANERGPATMRNKYNDEFAIPPRAQWAAITAALAIKIL
jgi:hypothetical protein